MTKHAHAHCIRSAHFSSSSMVIIITIIVVVVIVTVIIIIIIIQFRSGQSLDRSGEGGGGIRNDSADIFFQSVL